MMKRHYIKNWGTGLLCLMFLFAAGCGGDEDKPSKTSKVVTKKIEKPSTTVRKEIDMKPPPEPQKTEKAKPPKEKPEISKPAPDGTEPKKPASVVVADAEPERKAPVTQEIRTGPEKSETTADEDVPETPEPSEAQDVREPVSEAAPAEEESEQKEEIPAAPTPPKEPESRVEESPEPVPEEIEAPSMEDRYAALPPELIEGGLVPPKAVGTETADGRVVEKGPDEAEEEYPVFENKTISKITGIGRKKKQAGIVEEYEPAGKIDPFKPLIAQEDPEKIKEKQRKRPPPERLTPLQKMDLSQLKLVAIIRAETGNRAMVEEANGKGYIIKEGTPIGTQMGKVEKIMSDKVIVIEEEYDWKGNLKMIEREMIIHKPAGEF